MGGGRGNVCGCDCVCVDCCCKVCEEGGGREGEGECVYVGMTV